VRREWSWQGKTRQMKDRRPYIVNSLWINYWLAPCGYTCNASCTAPPNFWKSPQQGSCSSGVQKVDVPNRGINLLTQQLDRLIIPFSGEIRSMAA
jgi:hypothetical protein